MKTFLVSLPRTRSSLLYELLKGYHVNKFKLKEIKGHSEFFLEWGRNMELCDRKTEEYHTTELYPVAHKDGIRMHFVYPWILNDTKSRNIYKINLLKEEKNKGNEYYIKGTLNIAEECAEILEFFKDRKIILTERKNKELMYMSFFFSWESKIFHARNNNIDLYKKKLKEGVVVPRQIVLDYIPFVSKYDTIKKYLITNNFDYSIVTYEDLSDVDVISNILETDEWKNYANFKTLPIEIEKDFKKIIHNYEEVKQILVEQGAI
jgi:hypothetical protein